MDPTDLGHDADEPFADRDLIEGIPRHFEDLLGPVATVYHENTSEFIHLDVFRFDPTAEFDAFTFVTSGMASKPMNVPAGVQDPDNYRFAELILHLPADWPIEWEEFKKPENLWPMTALKSFARLPHERDAWVWGGHTLSNGELEPYSSDSRFCAALLSPSFQLPTQFEVLDLPDGRSVVFLTLAFLYREEWEFTVEHYSNALFDRIRKAGLSPMAFLQVNGARTNVCA